MNKATGIDRMDLLLYAVMPFAEQKEAAEYERAAEVSVNLSEKDKKQILKQIRRAGEYRERNGKYCPVRETLKRAAVIVLVTATVLFGGMMAIKPVRAAIWDVIMNWYDEYIGFVFHEEEAPPTSIEEAFIPKTPPGWTITDEQSNDLTVFYVMRDSSGDKIVYQQFLISDDENVWIDNEVQEIETIRLPGGIEGQLFIYDNRVLLIWHDRYAFMIRGSLENREIVIDMAEDIAGQ